MIFLGRVRSLENTCEMEWGRLSLNLLKSFFRQGAQTKCRLRQSAPEIRALCVILSEGTYWESHKICRESNSGRYLYGAVAQLGERLNGIQEVRGSIPLSSTSPPLIFPTNHLFTYLPCLNLPVRANS